MALHTKPRYAVPRNQQDLADSVDQKNDKPEKWQSAQRIWFSHWLSWFLIAESPEGLKLELMIFINSDGNASKKSSDIKLKLVDL